MKYIKLLCGLLGNEIPYDREQTPGKLSSELLMIQAALRQDKSIPKIPLDLFDNTLAVLARVASLVAMQHNDPETRVFFLQVEKGFRVEEVKEPVPQINSKPFGLERITVKGFMSSIRIPR